MINYDPRLLPQELQTLAAGLDNPGDLAVGRHAGRGRRESAVLIMLGLESLDLTFTERAATLRSHPGQISFPGGSSEPGESPAETALREAQEEIGLQPGVATVFGELPTLHIPVSSFTVHPVVALWQGDAEIRPVDAGEVAAVHRFGVHQLADPDHRLSWHIPGHDGPGFVIDDVFIWGFTAYLVDAVLRLGGWERTWDASRVAPVPQRFLRDRR